MVQAIQHAVLLTVAIHQKSAWLCCLGLYGLCFLGFQRWNKNERTKCEFSKI